MIGSVLGHGIIKGCLTVVGPASEVVGVCYLSKSHPQSANGSNLGNIQIDFIWFEIRDQIGFK
jgi:hypothetical protein